MSFDLNLLPTAGIPNDQSDKNQRIESDQDLFNFIECNLIACAVVKLRRSGRFVRSNRLSAFDRAAIIEIHGDFGDAE